MAAADTPGGDTVKKRALVRLAIAGMVTTLALAGLWWLDRQRAEPPGAPPETPKPIVSAPQPEPPPPVEEEAPVEPTEAAEVGPEIAPPPTSDTVKAMKAPAPGTSERPAPPPPRVSNDASLPPRSAATTPSQPARQTSVVEQAAGKPAGPQDFIVQLGVFSNPTYAQELVQRLNRQGIRAYTETRVLVGPFLNQREADKARAELARQGIKGVVSEAASQ